MPRIRLCLAALALSLAACVSTPAPTTAPPSSTAPKVSSFGKYSGYSEPVYDGWVRSSRYVTVRDGTRLAVDVFRPSLGGKMAEEKLPVVWTHHPVSTGGLRYANLGALGFRVLRVTNQQIATDLDS